MRWHHVLRLRLRSVLRRERVDVELDRELRFHFEQQIEENIAAGMPPPQARDAARRAIGSAAHVAEQCRDTRRVNVVDATLRDFAFALRTFRRSPGFSGITVVTLALGIGATTAVSSVVSGVLLAPLPFAEPERLVRVAEVHQVGGAGSVLQADLEEFRARSTAIERFTGYGLTTRHLRGAAGVERLTAVVTDPEFFSVLGIRPIAGRTFAATDAPDVVVLSGRLWERRFNRNPSIVGSAISLDGETFDASQARVVVERRSYTVLGVMPDWFQFPFRAASVYSGSLTESQTDLWMLAATRPGGRAGAVTARLRPGVSVAGAAADLAAIEARLDEIAPGPYRPLGVQVTALSDDVLGPVRGWLWLFAAAVALVLAAACTNVATLLLVRTTSRTRELATRASLGASPRRLAHQLLTEAAVLSAAGGIGGAALARWGTDLLIAAASARIPRAYAMEIDWRVFALALLACSVTAVLFGVAPALGAVRSGWPASAPGWMTPDHRTWLRSGFVAAQVAFGVVLACGAVAVIGEIRRLDGIDTGMVTDNVFTLHITPRMPDTVYYRIEERVARVPGVAAAGLGHMVPLQNWGSLGTFRARDRPVPDASQMPTAELRYVTPGYFDALGISLRAGRLLVEADSRPVPGPILVNETFVTRHSADADPIGRTLDRGTIVGVVEDVRHVAIDRPAEPVIYFPLNRNAGIASDIGMSLIVRSTGAPEAVIDSVRAAVREVNPNLAMFNVRAMQDVIADSRWQLDMYRQMVTFFAALTMVLGSIGLYGVMAYSVTRRRREFAIRLAVGSDHRRLLWQVLAGASSIAAIGAGIGAAAVLVLTPGMRAVHAGLEVGPLVIAGISTLTIALAMCASAVPAARAAAVSAVTALKEE